MRPTSLVIIAGLLLAAAGCVSPNQYAEQQADMDGLKEDVARLKERLNGIQVEQQNLAKELDAIRNATPQQDPALKARLDATERQLQAVNAAREQDRKAVVDELSHKMAAVMSTQAASGGGRSGSGARSAETGYEHIVKPGESLSAIAAAYKVSVSAILKANNLSSPNLLRVGQKLFIPR